MSDDVASKPTTVRLDDRLRAELHEAARQREISDAQFVRDAISFYLGWLARDSGYTGEADEKR